MWRKLWELCTLVAALEVKLGVNPRSISTTQCLVSKKKSREKEQMIKNGPNLRTTPILLVRSEGRTS